MAGTLVAMSGGVENSVPPNIKKKNRNEVVGVTLRLLTLIHI